jgi:hypothetical protein
MNKSVEALAKHTRAHIYIHVDGIPKTTYSDSGELRTCKFIRISRSKFFTIMIFGSSHDFGPDVFVM